MQAPTIAQNIDVFDKRKLSTQQDLEVIKAAEHLVQVCKLYLPRHAEQYLASQAHVDLVLDMLVTAVVLASPLRLEERDEDTPQYQVTLYVYNFSRSWTVS